MRGKEKKQIICLIFVLLSVVILGSGPVSAANEGNGTEDSALQAAYYLIPRGPENEIQKKEEKEEKGKDFWLYVELLDEQKNSIFKEDWTLAFAVINEKLGIDREGDMEPWQNQGYIHRLVQLIPEEESYSNYKIYLKAENTEGIQLESETAAPDLFLPWPDTESREWRKEVKSEKEITSSSFTFNWEDNALFSRLFTVKTEQIPEGMEVEKDEENQDWVMHAAGFTEGTMNIVLSDIVGDEEIIPYEIAITEKSSDPVMLIIIGAMVFFLILLCITLVKKGRRHKRDEARKRDREHHQEALLDKRKELDEVWENLKKVLDQWKQERKMYLDFLKNNEEFIRKIGDYEIYMQIAEEENPGIMPEHLEASYQKARDKMIDYADNYEVYLKEWGTKENLDFFENVILDLGDEVVKNQEKSENLRRSKTNLLEQIRQLQKQKQEMEKPLGIRLKIKFTVDGESYVIARRDSARGFLVDEQKPLETSKGSRQSSRSMEEILGKKTELRVSARNGKTILLETHGHDLYEGSDMVESKELAMGSRITLTWKREDSEEPVCIEITTF